MAFNLSLYTPFTIKKMQSNQLSNKIGSNLFHREIGIIEKAVSHISQTRYK